MLTQDPLPLPEFETASTGLVAARAGGIYGTHAYHTKVPPEAIARCVEAYSEPGEVVLDPFCGSGMTGVAAAVTGRRAFLNDLSPAAAHIAANYTAPCDPDRFREAVRRVLKDVGSEVAAFYRTDHDGSAAVVQYIVWSDVRTCPACQAEQSMWQHRDAGLREIQCVECRHIARKSDMPLVGEVPVEANVSLRDRQRIVRVPRDDDLAMGRIPTTLPWYPTIPFDSSRPMWRRGHADLGIKTVADFYSRRNLAAFALLWDSASREPDARLRSALRFSLTAIANRASRRYQWNAKRPTNVLGGTLYISSLRYEWNALSLWERKARAVERFFRRNPIPPDTVETRCGTATRLSLEDASVDYCFTDPPFGGHIVYSDSSLLWEAWLDDLTDPGEEAIVVRSGQSPKSVDDYQRLMARAFSEISRVLKRDRHATVVFQATDGAVWRAIQTAAQAAGLALVDATTLHKGQPSFKQIKGRLNGERVAATDVVLTLRKGTMIRSSRVSTPLDAARDAIREAIATGRPVTTGHLFASINARLLSDGNQRALSYAEVAALLEEHFAEERDGWALAA